MTFLVDLGAMDTAVAIGYPNNVIVSPLNRSYPILLFHFLTEVDIQLPACNTEDTP